MTGDADSSFGLGGILLIVVVVGAVALYFTFGSSENKTNQQKSLAELKEKNTVRIGYANEEPFGYLDTKNKNVTGEAPEIARVILSRMGIENVEPVVTEFGALIPGLKAGRFDMIAAGMYITPERCKEVSFSDPTYRISESFIVRKGNPLSLHSFEDVAQHAEAKIGVMGGAQEHTYAREVGVPEERIVIFPDNLSGIAGLKAGRVDCVAATALTVNVLLRKADSDSIERATPFKDPVIDGVPKVGYGAFAFRKKDQEIRDTFNAELKKFIGSPEHLELVYPFGFSKETLPGSATTEQLCKGQVPTEVEETAEVTP